MSPASTLLDCVLFGKYGTRFEIGSQNGRHIGVFGSADTGKTEFLEKIAGLRRLSISESAMIRGVSVGCLTTRDLSESVAYVPTNPTLIFSGIGRTLQSELELSLSVLAHPPNSWPGKITACMAEFDLESFLHRDPFTLSGGERVRAALAVALIKDPLIVLVDDIFPNLDPEQTLKIHARLASRAQNNQLIIETHSRIPPFHSAFTSIASLNGEPTSNASIAPSAAASSTFLRSHRSNESTIGVFQQLLVKEVSFFYSRRDHFQLGPITHEFGSGLVYALTGPNGSGKSTFLRLLAGLYDAVAGTVSIDSGDQCRQMPAPRKRHEWARHIQLCFQEPDDQLYLSSVRAEISEGLRRFSKSDVQQRCEVVADAFDLTRVLNMSPHDLSRPLRRLVTLATVLGAAPPLVLLDEPTASLDDRLIAIVTQQIRSHVDHGGTVILVSHDDTFVSKVATKRIAMCDGCFRAPT
jgi:energy-coupling factor transporter ATP-binding protein EcfA2